MGHSSISITLDIYCHWIPGEGRKNLEKSLLDGGKSCTKACTKMAYLGINKKATPVSN